jgi:hypothetical protein
LARLITSAPGHIQGAASSMALAVCSRACRTGSRSRRA